MDRMTWEEYAAKNPNLMNLIPGADLARLEGEIREEDRKSFYEKLMEIDALEIKNKYSYARQVAKSAGYIR